MQNLLALRFLFLRLNRKNLLPIKNRKVFLINKNSLRQLSLGGIFLEKLLFQLENRLQILNGSQAA